MNNHPSNHPWRRIEYLIENIRLPGQKRVRSVEHFANLLGLCRGGNLNQIKRSENGITRELAEAINQLCPSCSPEWLMTGRGTSPAVPIPTSLGGALPADVPDGPQSPCPCPWWPDCGPGEHSGSILGRWQWIGSLHYFQDDEPARWEKIPERTGAQSPLLSQEFRADGLVDYLEDDRKTDTKNYAYDPSSGRLVAGGDCVLVSKLTATELECIDWADMVAGGVTKERYKRI